MSVRSAAFTDSASGKARATSGARRTVSPKRVRPGPSRRTRRLCRSYSGLKSSETLSAFFICFSFRARRVPRANDSDLRSLRVGYHE